MAAASVDYEVHAIPAPVKTLESGSGHEVSQIVAGGYHTCAIVDGGILCWGSNYAGQLGLGANGPEEEALPVPVAGLGPDAGLDIKFLATGTTHSCAASGSRIWCWGSNDDGQLGIGTDQSHPQPQEVFGVPGEILALSAGGFASCAATTAGTFCWGYGVIFADGVDHLLPTKIEEMSGDVVAVDVGFGHLCVVTATGTVHCQGHNSYGELGNGDPDSDFVTASTLDEFEAIEVTAGPDHTCARSSTDTLWCWGRKGQGQLGNGQDRRQREPGAATIASGATEVSSGLFHSCGAVSNGAMCWGTNLRGQLGNNSRVDTTGPVQVHNLSGPLSSISAGNNFTCATSGGIVRCWGTNQSLQSGQPDAEGAFLVPQTVAGISSALSVDAGDNHACATNAAGALACWGKNNRGQLSGMQPESASPVVALPNGATRGSAGDGFTCAVRNGGVYCWGSNARLQLGREGPGSPLPESVPAFPEGGGVTAVAAGNGFACAIASGGIECWGRHDSGQGGWGLLPGDDDSEEPPSYFAQPSPVVGLPAGSTATWLSAGKGHACAVADGAAWCWGSNDEGQLGDGTTDDRYTAVAVRGLPSGVTRISAGYQHTCAVVSGAVKCWGNLEDGRLGNYSTPFRSTPVAVVPARLFESGFE